MLGLWHSVYHWPSTDDSWQSTSLRFQRDEETGDVAVFAVGAVYDALILLCFYMFYLLSTHANYVGRRG